MTVQSDRTIVRGNSPVRFLSLSTLVIHRYPYKYLEVKLELREKNCQNNSILYHVLNDKFKMLN